jgi:hypothetical protein
MPASPVTVRCLERARRYSSRRTPGQDGHRISAHTPGPSRNRMTDVGTEQPQRIPITADCRLLPTTHRAQIAEELLSHDRGPRPRELVGHLESLHDPDPTCDRLVVEVAAQLLVAPPLKHLPHRLRLSVQQWNRPHRIDATALIDGQNGLQPGSSNESLNHPVNHYDIGAGTRINLGTFVAACRPRLGIRCRLLYYARFQSCCVGAFSIVRGRDLRRRRVNQS